MFAQTKDRVFVIDDAGVRIKLDPHAARLAREKIDAFLDVIEEQDRRKAHGHPLKAFDHGCGRCKIDLSGVKS